MRRDQQGLRRQLQRLRQQGGADVEAVLARLAEKVAVSQRGLQARKSAVPRVRYPEELPVSGKKDEIVAAIKAHQVVIVCGETGSGKTTQLPKICLEAGRGLTGYIGHTQPRRIAARSVAARIAEELGQPLGKAVGYKIRFQDTTSPEAYVKLMTDGILLAETQQDRFLDHYDTLIVDEAHERSLNIDFLLGYLRWVLPKRPDLKVIITSATIDPERFSRHFGGAPIINVSGRTYPVEMRYRPIAGAELEIRNPLPQGEGRVRGLKGRGSLSSLTPTLSQRERGPEGEARDQDGGSGELTATGKVLVPRLPDDGKKKRSVDESDETERDLQQAILDAADELHRERAGDILVFLSGEREIRETAESLRKHHPPHVEVLPLYSKLAVADQEKIFKPHGRDRIVLATNVAETSLTVPGIRCVIDAGHARISRYSHRSKLQRLPIEKVSQASANQRAGRCGRIGPGICIRLYSEEDYRARPEFTEPEILRTNLAAVILQMRSLGLGDIAAFPFIEPPDERLIRDGVKTLQELGALDEQQNLTAVGRQLAKLPLDPRLGRMLVAAAKYNCLTEVAAIAAALSLQDPRERPMDKTQAADQAHAKFKHEQSDFLGLYNLWVAYHEQKPHLSNSKLRGWCRENFLSYIRMREWEDIHHQINQLVKGELNWRPNQVPAGYAEIHKALLTGLLGNVGLKGEQSEYSGARGLKFQIFPGSFLFKSRPQWIVCAEQVETAKVYARTVAKIEPDWIEEVGGHLVKRTHYDPHWERKPARVAVHERSALYGLIVQAGRKVPYENINPAGAREIFIREALVQQEYDCRAEFFRHNQSLLQSADYLQQKGRRVDLVVDEEWLYRFYDERLPPHVCSGASFDRWRREVEKTDPKLLLLTKDDVTRREDESLDTVNYPDHLDVGDGSVRLEYRFAPGDPEDGVTAIVPLHQLNQLSKEPFDWLVPGLLREKLIALLKSLPKDLRRKLVPVPDTVDRLLPKLAVGEGVLTQSVGALLKFTYGLTVPDGAWDEASLTEHLRMNYRVMDEKGKVLVTSRDLGDLQRRYGAQAGQTFQSLAAKSLSISGCTDWQFGDIPIRSDTKTGKTTVPGYAALVDEGDAVGLKSFDTEAEARWRHRCGLSRLIQLALAKDIKYLRKNLAVKPPHELAYAKLAGLPFRQTADNAALRDDLLGLVVQSLYLDDQPDIRSEKVFRDRLERHRGQLIEQANTASVLSAGILDGAATLEKTLAAWPANDPCAQDMREQLRCLVYAGFVRTTSLARLKEYPRYLKALQHRLDKLRQDPGRDRRQLDLLKPYWARYWDYAKQPLAAAPEDDAFRWLLEEFRVSLFAQHLKTPVPVSAKRLDEMWGGRQK
ncbi:ATP-dependent helicase [Methylogaea oryzae]|uniref:ATP-dependent helicase n=2 Tax=Methylogaea oryzae TaxID=1295382 RepID=A0A8D5AJG5_9GAMM|nr:ATP-dependent helicase [Methylogaea oryzae]